MSYRRVMQHTWGEGTSVPSALSSFSGKLSPSPIRVRHSQHTGTRVDGGHYSIPESETGRYSPHPSPFRRNQVRTAEAPHVKRKKKITDLKDTKPDKAATPVTAPTKQRRNSLVAVQKQLRSDVSARVLPWQCAPHNKARVAHSDPPASPTTKRLSKAAYDGYEPFVKSCEFRGTYGGECVLRTRTDLSAVTAQAGSSKFYNWPTRPWYPPAVLRRQGYTRFRHSNDISRQRNAPVDHARVRNGVAFLPDTPIRTQNRPINTIEKDEMNGLASAAMFRGDDAPTSRERLLIPTPLAPSPVGSPTGHGGASSSWAVHSDALGTGPPSASGVRFFNQGEEQAKRKQEYMAQDLEAAKEAWEVHAHRLEELHAPALVALSQLLRLALPDPTLLATGDWAVNECAKLTKLKAGQAMAAATLAQAMAACYREKAHELEKGEMASTISRSERNQEQQDAEARACALDQQSAALCDAALCKEYFASGRSISVLEAD